MSWSHTCQNSPHWNLLPRFSDPPSSAAEGSNLCRVHQLSEYRSTWAHCCGQTVIDLPHLPSGTPTRECHPFSYTTNTNRKQQNSNISPHTLNNLPLLQWNKASPRQTTYRCKGNKNSTAARALISANTYMHMHAADNSTSLWFWKSSGLCL